MIALDNNSVWKLTYGLILYYVMNAPCYPYSIVIFKGFYLYLMQ